MIRRLTSAPGSVAGALLGALVLSGCGDAGFTEGYLDATARRTRHQVTNEVRLRARQFAPTVMRVDLTEATERERKLLESLLRAAGLADEIFWLQTSPLAVPYRAQVRASYPRDHIVREFYVMQMGPYDRLDGDRPYMAVPPRPAGAGFYPPDLTVQEFRAWLEDHPGDRGAFRDPHTVIRRRGDDGDSLVAVPYHEAYRELVEPMAAALRQAASHAENPRLEHALQLEARAVLTDDHHDADTAWARVDDARFDLLIGPHDRSEDRLLGLKAAYRASVVLVDSAATAELERYRRHLEETDLALPYPDPDSLDADATQVGATSTEQVSSSTARESSSTAQERPGGGLELSTRAVRDVYRGGHISTGYQSAAAHLPAHPQRRSAAGSKTIVWKNIVDARFDSVVAPIGHGALAEEQRDVPSPDALLRLVALQEMAHGLGPRLAPGGEGQATADHALGDRRSWIEENRADVVGVLAMERLTDEGVLEPEGREARLVTYLASLLREVRFGTGGAHGRAALVSLAWFLRNGGVSYDSAATRYRVEAGALRRSVRSLAGELARIEATKDRARAEEILEAYGTRRPSSLEAVLAELADLPVEIVPRYRIRW